MSEYYDHGNFPLPNTKTNSAAMRAELDAIEAGFQKLPVLSGNAGKLVRVKADASGLESVPVEEVVGDAAVSSVAGKTGEVTLVKADVGLGNVDNTSDANKPVSIATQTALDGKSDTGHDHAISDVTGLQTALDAKANSSSLGTAATKTAGTGAGEVLLLTEAGKLPALDASLLTGIPVPEAENPIRQVVWFETGAYASGSATIPQDDTIPQQSTDGTQFMSQVFTPTAADSIIEVEVLANLDNQSGTYAMAGALFKDATEDAIAVGRTNSYFTSGCQLLMRHREVAGSTTTRTYKFKAGTPSAVVTAFNGYTGRLMGGQMNSYIKITEYAP